MAAIAQVARKLRGKPMQRQNAFWLHEFDVAQQIVVIGVIGKRECGIDLISINGIRLDRPTADHGDAFTRNFFEHARAIRARRADQNFAGNFIGFVAFVFAKRLAELFVDSRHLINRSVQHRGKTRAGERAQNLLRFA